MSTALLNCEVLQLGCLIFLVKPQKDFDKLNKMWKDWKVKETRENCNLAFVSKSNRVQIMLRKLRNQAKLDKTEKLWNFSLRIELALVPRFYSCKEDWAIGSALMHF